MNPVVGYAGGKRRLPARLRPYFPIEKLTLYVELFVGMGANYLDVRARGYRGRAILADSNPCVAAFWRAVHDREHGARLVQAAQTLGQEKATTEMYRRIVAAAEDNEHTRIAKFLWLTNYAFANDPPLYLGSGWRAKGTKLTSAEAWGKTFPWPDCVERLRAVVDALTGLSCEIHDDGVKVLSALSTDAQVYADPPYLNSIVEYHAERVNDRYVKAARDTAAELVALSEKSDLATLLPGWQADDGSVVQRVSKGTGAEGRRREWIYSRRENR